MAKKSSCRNTACEASVSFQARGFIMLFWLELLPESWHEREKSDKEGGGVERESFILLSHTPSPPPPPLLFFLFCFCFVCFFRFAFQPSRNNSSRERGAGSVVLVSITQKLLACRRLLFPLLHAEKEEEVPFPRATKEIGDVCTQATQKENRHESTLPPDHGII